MVESVVGATVAAALVATPSDVNATALDEGFYVHFWIDSRAGASLEYRWAIYRSTDPTFCNRGASDTALNAAIEANAELAAIYADI